MSDLPSTRTPLDRLVLFMIALAVAATVVGWVFFFTTEIHPQQVHQVPKNYDRYDCRDNCDTYHSVDACYGECKVKYPEWQYPVTPWNMDHIWYPYCTRWCDNNVGPQYRQCLQDCEHVPEGKDPYASP